MKKIKLKKKEKKFLKEYISKGKKKARSIARANVLLLLDQRWDNKSITASTGLHRQSIWRIKKRYLKEGIKSAITEKPRPGQPKKYSKKDKATLIATACSDPPKGRKRWTVRLLAKEMREKEGMKTMNRETVRLILKKTKQNLG
ncbi:helix-turn-helix domain-containing protein [Candidatus Woesearchaeota archaeon]|nr:helix-turn-helix domain-containing protein [Candidatus Woesearchaeota archaeon]